MTGLTNGKKSDEEANNNNNRRYKMQIHDEQDIYDNTAASVTLFRARTNTLLLGI